MDKGRSRLWTCVALCVIIWVGAAGLADAALFGLFGKGKPVAKKSPGVRKSLVIFPFDQGEVASLPEGFGEYVASDLRTMLGSGSDYFAYLFRDRLSPVVRAKNDNTLKTADMTPPFAEDREKALKLAQLLSSDYLLVGTIDGYSVDPKTKVATLTVSAELVDAKNGRLIKMLSATGRSPETTKSAFEDETRDIAKGDAVTKLMAEIVAQPKAEPGAVTGPAAAPAAVAPAPAAPAASDASATPPAAPSSEEKPPATEEETKAPAAE